MTKPKGHKANIASASAFFDERYGKDDSKLAGWQTLCEDVGVEVGKSITQCKKNLKGVYVNIVDYVQAKQNKQTIHRFPSLNQLRKYSMGHYNKIFPLKQAKNHPMLQGLLVNMFG